LSERELINKFLNASPTERENLVNELLKDEFKQVLSDLSNEEFVSLIISIPPARFGEFIEKFGDIISEKIKKLDIKSYARLINELPGEVRKTFNKKFFSVMRDFVKDKKLRDILKMLYSVIPPTRSSLLSPWRPVMFSKDFQEKLLNTSLEELEAFLSTAPEDIRRQILRKHSNLFLSEEFRKKLKEAKTEEIVNLLRWFPKDLYDKFIQTHKDIFEERGLKL